MLTSREKFDLKNRSDAFVNLVHTIVDKSDFSQRDIAYLLEMSDANMSYIMNPLHQAEFTIKHLPTILKYIDGRRILGALADLLECIVIDKASRSEMVNSSDALQTLSQGIRDVVSSINRRCLTREEAIDLREYLKRDLAEINTALGKLIYDADCLDMRTSEVAS